MHAAEGILTTRGGMTSHAAVVARGMGRPCVSGAGELRDRLRQRLHDVRAVTLKAATSSPSTAPPARCMLGKVRRCQPELSGDFANLMDLGRCGPRMKVRTNAETPLDAAHGARVRRRGHRPVPHRAHVLRAGRIVAVREMILADDEAGRRAALDKILPMQRDDFAELFEIMAGLPVTIRLLDPPLHEFLPHDGRGLRGGQGDRARTRTAAAPRSELHECNPMLGHRGCRLAITYPEIYEMQARAIFEAASSRQEDRRAGEPEVMIPLVATRASWTC